jgi:excisionase family DNA binding protein
MSRYGLKLRTSLKPALHTADVLPAGAKKQDIARRYGVSTRTVDTWIQQKKIPFCRLSSRCIRFDLAAVDRALSRFCVKEVTP